MKNPITPKGLETLKEDLKKFKSERPIVASEIETARAHGDLSENADYSAAKEKSGILEAKIRDLESLISNAEVIDPNKIKDPKRVVFGVTVKLEEVETGEEKKYSIYGPSESDTSKGWISIDTPLAKALIGKSLGDVVEIRLPNGKKEFEVLDIFVEYDIS